MGEGVWRGHQMSSRGHQSPCLAAQTHHFTLPPAEKVMSLGRNWHRPCLRCQRCRKTLTAGRHAEVSRAGQGRAGLGRAGRLAVLGEGRLGLETQPDPDGSFFLSLSPQHDGVPYCHIPCYGYLFGPKGGHSPLPRHKACVQPVGMGTPPDSPQPRAPRPKALGDWTVFLRCEHWRCGLLHLRPCGRKVQMSCLPSLGFLPQSLGAPTGATELSSPMA